ASELIPGVEALASGGRFALRIALRSSIMPGYEIRSEVTAIGPTSADSVQFTVPADFVKVQGPGGANSQLHNSQLPTPNSGTPKTSKLRNEWGQSRKLKLPFLSWEFWELALGSSLDVGSCAVEELR